MDADQLVEKADKAMSMIESSIPAWIDGSEMILGDAITTEEMQAEGQRIADEMDGLKVQHAAFSPSCPFLLSLTLHSAAL